ncbi:hypothetical protein [Xenorhabdus thailandensis]
MSPPNISLIGLKKRNEDGMFSQEFLHYWWHGFLWTSKIMEKKE